MHLVDRDLEAERFVGDPLRVIPVPAEVGGVERTGAFTAVRAERTVTGKRHDRPAAERRVADGADRLRRQVIADGNPPRDRRIGRPHTAVRNRGEQRVGEEVVARWHVGEARDPSRQISEAKVVDLPVAGVRRLERAAADRRPRVGVDRVLALREELVPLSHRSAECMIGNAAIRRVRGRRTLGGQAVEVVEGLRVLVVQTELRLRSLIGRRRIGFGRGNFVGVGPTGLSELVPGRTILGDFVRRRAEAKQRKCHNGD